MFILNNRNEAYINGEKPPAFETTLSRAGIVILSGLMLLGVGMLYQTMVSAQFSTGLLAFTIVWNTVITLTTLAALHSVARRHALNKQGQIVWGQILMADGQIDSDGDYLVSVKFSFLSPRTHKVIQGRIQATRNDLKDRIPERGDRVAIQFVDDRLYALL